MRITACGVLAPTQSPGDARKFVAQYLEMKEAQVVVRPTFLGNGFGRKAAHDFICEAAWLAKTLSGSVKLIWTREDDVRHGYYLPISLQRLDGGLDKNGTRSPGATAPCSRRWARPSAPPRCCPTPASFTRASSTCPMPSPT